MTVNLRHTIWGNANLRAKVMSEREALMWISYRAGAEGVLKTTIRDLAAQLGWPIKTTHRFLRKLDRSSVIELSSDTRGTMITLCEIIETQTFQTEGDTLSGLSHIAQPADLRGWLEDSEPKDACLYHIGFLSRDRRKSPPLNLIAEAVRIMADAGALSLRADRIRLPALSAWAYVATRETRRVRPASLATGVIAPFEYRALQAVRDRDVDVSAERAIRNALSPIVGRSSDGDATDMLEVLKRRQFIQPAHGKGYELTQEGRSALM